MKIIYLLLISILIFSFSLQAQKDTKKSMFRDHEDDAFDVSNFLNSTAGFLPVPSIITEPAVGYGGMLALIYFHKRKEQGVRPLGLSPTMTFGGGAYTENGTWAAFVGHQGSYHKDRYRYTGLLGYVSPNLTFYNSSLIPGRELSLEFNIEGSAVFQEFLFRPKKTIPFFTGLNYIYFSNEVTFESNLNIPGLDKLTRKTNMAGMNATFLYDKRNNTFTPTTGVYAQLEIGAFSEKLGGDSDFYNFDARVYAYAPIVKDKLFSGYRIHLASKGDDAPFYAQPYVKLRGIPAMRYQNHNIMTLETEWRWQFYKRWSLVGFMGAGEAVKDIEDIDGDFHAAGGGGFRYFLAKQYGIHAGVDVAKSSEDWAWYLTVGSNWLR